ncbi:MAG TPA: EamA family transporter [Candidatus Saccharimonadia bacterium]|nr:EamA family transporter [Candidatus Saccharimonadia bacterium]
MSSILLFGIMPLWLIAALAAVAFTVTYELITKNLLNQNENHHPTAFASIAFMTVCVYAAVLYVILGVKMTDFQHLLVPQIGLILLADIVMYTIAPYFYYRALKLLPLSEVLILYSLTGAFALAVGVFLGAEPFYFSRLIGGIVILFSVVLLSIEKGKWKINKGFWLMLGATFFYALGATADNQLIAHNYFSNLFVLSITFGVPGILLFLLDSSARSHATRMFTRKIYPTIAVTALFFLLSFSSLFLAYRQGGTTSQVSFVLCTETIAVVVLAAIFLGERDNMKKKVIAAILACVGVFLLR